MIERDGRTSTDTKFAQLIAGLWSLIIGFYLARLLLSNVSERRAIS